MPFAALVSAIVVPSPTECLWATAMFVGRVRFRLDWVVLGRFEVGLESYDSLALLPVAVGSVVTDSNVVLVGFSVDLFIGIFIYVF